MESFNPEKEFKKFTEKGSLEIIIEPLYRCNLNCSYCYLGGKGETFQKEMTQQEVRNIFKKLFPYYKDLSFVWLGGEPTLMKSEFFEKIAVDQQKSGVKFRNCFTSNGVNVGPEYLELIRKDLYKMGISFDGPWQNEFRGKNTEEKVLETISKIREHMKGKPTIVVIMAGYNFDKSQELFDFLKKHKIQNFLYNVVYPTGNAKKMGYAVEEGMYGKAIIDMAKILIEQKEPNELIEGVTVNSFLSSLLNKKSTLCINQFCLGNCLHVSPYGKIGTCRGNENFFCHVNELKRFQDLYKNKEFLGYKERVFKRMKICSECEWYESCLGGCPADLADPESPIEFCYCEDFKEIFESFSKILKERLKSCKLNQTESRILEQSFNKCYRLVSKEQLKKIIENQSNQTLKREQELVYKLKKGDIVKLGQDYYDLTRRDKEEVGPYLSMLIERELN